MQNSIFVCMKNSLPTMLKTFQDKFPEAGCDEAGRGCLAGPVVAAAVILPENYNLPLLRDSKKITEAQRNVLRPLIEKQAVAWAIGICSPREIDEHNILKASFLAMHKALDGLAIKPKFVAVDGNRFIPYPDTPHACIVKGDDKVANIAAASILAKTYRDDLMAQLHEEFPQYNWKSNKGYPTGAHRKAISEIGPSPHHRTTFQLLPKQLKMDF